MRIACLACGKEEHNLLRDRFRGRLRELVHDTLGTGGFLRAELISPVAMQRILVQHDRGTADHASKICLVQLLTMWIRAPAACGATAVVTAGDESGKVTTA